MALVELRVHLGRESVPKMPRSQRVKQLISTSKWEFSAIFALKQAIKKTCSRLFSTLTDKTGHSRQPEHTSMLRYIYLTTS
jgi:hypothetical protein